MMKIAVLSDTHNLLRPEVIDIIKDSNVVIHGGDINSQGVLYEIKSVMKPNAQLCVVRGKAHMFRSACSAAHQHQTMII